MRSAKEESFIEIRGMPKELTEYILAQVLPLLSFEEYSKLMSNSLHSSLLMQYLTSELETEQQLGVMRLKIRYATREDLRKHWVRLKRLASYGMGERQRELAKELVEEVGQRVKEKDADREHLLRASEREHGRDGEELLRSSVSAGRQERGSELLRGVGGEKDCLKFVRF